MPRSWSYGMLLPPHMGAMTVTITDMLPWTAQIRYCHLVHQHFAWLTPMTGVEDPPLDIIVTPDAHTMITRIDPDSVTPDLAPVTTDTGIVATRTPVEVSPDHSIDLPITVSHDTKALVPTTTTATHLTTDLHLIRIFPKMTSDLNINPGSNTTDQPEDPHPPHRHHIGNIRIRDTRKLPLMTHCQNTTAQITMTVTQKMI